MNNAISANSTCAEAHVPSVHVVSIAHAPKAIAGQWHFCTLINLRMRGRKYHGTPVGAGTASPVYRRSLRWVWWLFSCYWVVTLSAYQGAYVAFPRAEGVASSLLFVAYTRLLVAHTEKPILVLLSKLTIAPTKLHTGCIALRDFGVCLHLL